MCSFMFRMLFPVHVLCITNIHNITPVIPEGLDRGVPNITPTFGQLCFKSHIIGREPIAINRAQI